MAMSNTFEIFQDFEDASDKWKDKRQDEFIKF
jgi:hypothetical protein